LKSRLKSRGIKTRNMKRVKKRKEKGSARVEKGQGLVFLKQEKKCKKSKE